MADDSSPVFLEVFCEISGKEYRFTAGTKAEFVVSVINRKLGSLKSRVVYIEAVKEGEEPISFGNDAILVNYGHGWKLKTVIESEIHGTEKKNDLLQRDLPRKFASGSKDSKSTSVEGDQSLKYIGRIMVAFLFMFILGGLFTIALENLPGLILLFYNSSI
ncbi:unnamed protein product [Arabis nemorensis]|uniref:Uncharacterized protein n=1 Tax=Arabis nemorensis TaxID=586526 RepID=A0A565C628_9BRAS|nr:unnamed protein product [Arabis nemorensis]